MSTASGGEADKSAIRIVDPYRLFEAWLDLAGQQEINDPNAMALATAGPDGMPSVRMMLLKAVDAQGFVFYTNFNSRKGQELIANPQAALLFHWKSLRRQVRVEGPVAPVAPAEADAYFASRPRGSRIGAWASQQSAPLDSPASLKARVAELEARYADGEVPRPPHWSGYRLNPARIEFWEDMQFRLHNRIVFTADPAQTADDPDRGLVPGWTTQRLNP